MFPWDKFKRKYKKKKSRELVYVTTKKKSLPWEEGNPLPTLGRFTPSRWPPVDKSCMVASLSLA